MRSTTGCRCEASARCSRRAIGIESIPVWAGRRAREMADSPHTDEEEMLAALGLGFLGTILVGIASVIIVWVVRRA